MHVLSLVGKWTSVLVLGAGLAWSIILWRARRREAILDATACVLQLATLMLWTPTVERVFYRLPEYPSQARHILMSSSNFLTWTANTVSYGLIIFAALGKKEAGVVSRKP